MSSNQKRVSRSYVYLLIFTLIASGLALLLVDMTKRTNTYSSTSDEAELLGELEQEYEKKTK